MNINDEIRLHMTETKNPKGGQRLEVSCLGLGSFEFTDLDLIVLAKDCINGLNALMKKQVARKANYSKPKIESPIKTQQ